MRLFKIKEDIKKIVIGLTDKKKFVTIIEPGLQAIPRYEFEIRFINKIVLK